MCACHWLVRSCGWQRGSEPRTNIQQLTICTEVQPAQGSWEPLPGLGMRFSPRSPPRSSPRTTDSAFTFLLLGTSLIHVFPVTAATSSHPLRELFLTDLCISYMRNTSTSVLVRFTGKCCNRAQLSNIRRRGAVGKAVSPPQCHRN